MSDPRSPLYLDAEPSMPVLVVTEGVDDAKFLKRISQALHAKLEEAPDLALMARRGKVKFRWLAGEVNDDRVFQVAALALPQVHLYCRRSTREFRRRQVIVERLNELPNCTAFLTQKRSLENYLHPEVVRTRNGATISVEDETEVAYALARRHVAETGGSWNALSGPARRLQVRNARRWLCTKAACAMTIDLLEKRDQRYELIDWLMVINSMVAAQDSCLAEGAIEMPAAIA